MLAVKLTPNGNCLLFNILGQRCSGDPKILNKFCRNRVCFSLKYTALSITAKLPKLNKAL